MPRWEGFQMSRIFGTLLLLVFTGAAIAQEPQPVGTMSQLMVDIIYPTSDAIFYAGRTTPLSVKEWEDLQRNALMLAEAGNLLMMPNRARDKEMWMKDARLLVDAGAAAYKAAKAKDLDAVLALNEQLYNACVYCHEDYRPNYRKRSGRQK
jgi:hypothetical protein